MTAAVVHDFGQAARRRARCRSRCPATDEVLVRIETSGLCHTDIHAAHGDWPVKPAPPFIPGHEGVGIVEALGPASTRSRSATGSRCRGSATRAARATTASPAGRPCASSSGTPATRSTAASPSTSKRVRPLRREGPEGIDPLDAAPLTCAGVTTYKAVKVAGTRPTDLVAIFGVGGLGHLALQYAAIAGGHVVAVDVLDEKLALATELGASSHGQRARRRTRSRRSRRSAAPTRRSRSRCRRAAFEQAYRSLRRGGTLVFVALPTENHVELPIFETVLNGITVVGSIVGTRNDLREVFELHAAGRTRVIRETRPLADVNEAIADVEAGRVPARIVFTP